MFLAFFEEAFLIDTWLSERAYLANGVRVSVGMCLCAKRLQHYGGGILRACAEVCFCR